MFFRPLIAPANEGTNRSRSGVKDIDAIFFNNFPEAIRLRPVRRAPVHDGRRAIREGAVNDVTMAGYPADVCGAPENIFIADVEDVFGGRVNTDQISAGSMQNSFRFSGRTAR